MENLNREIIAYCIDCKDPIFEGEKYYIDEHGFYHHKVCADEKALYFDGFGFVGEEED